MRGKQYGKSVKVSADQKGGDWRHDGCVLTDELLV